MSRDSDVVPAPGSSWTTGRANHAPGGLRIFPLGGLGEIGMNCMVLEYEDEILVLDCGLMFSDLDHFGVEFVIPDFGYLRERKDKVKGIVLTHGHEDHIGALTFLLKAGIRAPVYASSFTSMLVKHRLKENGLDSATTLHTFKMGEVLKFKHFSVETVSVNHSIVDAAALIIKTPLGVVIHTGDFRIDPNPFYGDQIDLARFGRAGEEGVLLLLSDSTNVERCTHSTSESVIFQKFEELFAAAQGLTMVAMFASNVGRMGQVMKLAQKMGKKVALCGRGMEQNARFAQEIGYLEDAVSVVVPLDEIDRYRRKDVLILSTGSQAELGSALQRVSLGEHKQLQLGEGDRVLMSSRSIPGNEKSIGRMINNLFRQGADVLYEAVHDIHVSGHATRPELKKMIELTKPRFFMPIHGEYRHLVHHAAVARESGVAPENVIVGMNGDVLEIAGGKFEVIDHCDDPRILVEDRVGGDVSKLMLKERRQLGEKGVVFALMVRDSDTGIVISGPEIIAKGVAKESMEGFLVEEGRAVARKVINEYEKQRRNGGPDYDLEEEIRVELRRFFNQNIGRKPTVIPLILEV